MTPALSNYIDIGRLPSSSALYFQDYPQQLPKSRYYNKLPILFRTFPLAQSSAHLLNNLSRVRRSQGVFFPAKLTEKKGLHHNIKCKSHKLKWIFLFFSLMLVLARVNMNDLTENSFLYFQLVFFYSRDGASRNRAVSPSVCPPVYF